MSDFCHLHCHTQFSLLDGANNIPMLMAKAKADGQKAVALTDHGNMFGAYNFVNEANKQGIKPILGCEFYLVKDRHRRSFSKSAGEKDRRNHQLLLAKNAIGYRNITKLCSLGFLDGVYMGFPRIDHEILQQHTEGIIATSCCLAAEIPQAILHGNLELAEKKVKWWKDLFGEDFYIELMRHNGLENIDNSGVSQEDINQHLIRLATKYDIKIIATNDAHYLEQVDAPAHDILLCINTRNQRSTEKRFKFSSNDYFFKTKQEMSQLFADLPHALDNTMEIADKVSSLNLQRDIMLPSFQLPKGFKTQKDYLQHLVYQGALPRYGELTQLVKARLDHELQILHDMNFEGYFLIVQDLINAAKELGVWVGPGRGSAAGSAVAYCLGITNIDPIKYNLLFERFLNPERVSMPDIDIDFDDENRQKVIDYVVEKYGRNQVAQIITFGTLGAKSSVRDVGRVLELPLSDTDRLSKLIPARAKNLQSILGKTTKELKDEFTSDELVNIEKLNSHLASDGLESEVLEMAAKVEGNVRSTGIHAAGIIIAPTDITDIIPVSTSKESDLLVTQFDGSVVEDAGLLKMDFLGLKNLSIIRTAIENIVMSHGEEARIDLDKLSLDDERTYQLFQRGHTAGIFQFESEGMQKHLISLKPNNIEDLIAMNALYRPGPMDNIPEFVDRKHGKKQINYPHPWLEEILKPTYGIMVYQEQIMQTAQIIAGYSLGQADILRRAMGKKKLKEMEKQRHIFVEGATKKGVDEDQALEIFETMEKFASYGFNRSHAAAYSVIAYQGAYLKANYPAEYLAALLTHSKNDLNKVNFFLNECKTQNVTVLGPDVNESMLNFRVNKDGQIRFGLSALKGIGDNPVNAIVASRDTDGPFESIFDLVQRVNLKSINKKVLESLVLGGAFDCFTNINRSQYLAPSIDGNYEMFIEQVLKYGAVLQDEANSAQQSLFGESNTTDMPEPPPPSVEPWPLNYKLNREKEIAGLYLSGHPLDEYPVEQEFIVQNTILQAQNTIGVPVKIGAFVTNANHRTTKKGTGFGIFTIEDYSSELEFALFSEDYLTYKSLLVPGQSVYVEGLFQEDMYRNDIRFKVKKVKLLGSVLKEQNPTATINVRASLIDPDWISSFEQTVKTHKGSHAYKIAVWNEANNSNINLLSTKGKISLTKEAMQAFKELNILITLN